MKIIKPEGTITVHHPAPNEPPAAEPTPRCEAAELPCPHTGGAEGSSNKPFSSLPLSFPPNALKTSHCCFSNCATNATAKICNPALADLPRPPLTCGAQTRIAPSQGYLGHFRENKFGKPGSPLLISGNKHSNLKPSSCASLL